MTGMTELHNLNLVPKDSQTLWIQAKAYLTFEMFVILQMTHQVKKIQLEKSPATAEQNLRCKYVNILSMNQNIQ